jgi:Protein of unknown function (DUF4019)
MRNSVTKEQFVQKVAAARQPLGKVLSRVLKMARTMTSLPSAPDGEYVVLKYDTSFENKKFATETIAPMLEGTSKNIRLWYDLWSGIRRPSRI